MSHGAAPFELDEIERLLDQALALPAAERAGFVAQLTDISAAARERLENTLRQCEKIDAIAALFSRKSVRAVDAVDRIGARIGPYRLVRLLGEGGMGAVYLATREVGTARQEVALKLLHDKQGVRRARERFERERKILAAISHPGIAPLYDLGEADDGTPYYTMEYVDGLPIVAWCREHAPTVESRVRVLLRVATALAHAHRSLVVHRDIKPSNIFVRGPDDIKLLDFGIAKILETTGEPTVTSTAIAPMTLEYAAPEQLRGGAITVATDIYQFGALCYRVLTGALPYEGNPNDTYEWLRIVVEDDPRPMPRALLAEGGGIAWPATVPLSRTARRLAGDLDAIVRKAMKKEPDQRYRTMDAMAEDLDRFVTNRPVKARRAPPLYQTWRFVQRHVVESILLAISAVGFGLAVNELRLERDRAVAAELRQASEAEAGADLSALLAQVLAPLKTDGPDDDFVEVFVERLASEVRDQSAGSPGERSALVLLVANIYEGLGMWSQAQPLLYEAVAIREKPLAAPRAQVAQSLARLSNNLAITGDLAQAEAVAARTTALLEGIDGGPDVDQFHARRMHGLSLITLGHYRTALAYMQRARRDSERVFAADSRERIWAVWDEAAAQARLKMYASAIVGYDLAFSTALAKFGPNHVYSTRLALERSQVLTEVGRADEAETACRALLARDGGDTGLAEAHECLVSAFIATGRLDEAATHQATALFLFERLEGADSPRRASSLTQAAEIAYGRGAPEEALARVDAALAIQRRILPPTHPRLANSVVLRARILLDRGMTAGVGRELEAAVAAYDSAFGTDSGPTALASLEWARVEMIDGDDDAARARLAAAKLVLERLSPSVYRTRALERWSRVAGEVGA